MFLKGENQKTLAWSGYEYTGLIQQARFLLFSLW